MAMANEKRLKMPSFTRISHLAKGKKCQTYFLIEKC